MSLFHFQRTSEKNTNSNKIEYFSMKIEKVCSKLFESNFIVVQKKIDRKIERKKLDLIKFAFLNFENVICGFYQKLK